jgi:hypothetical protein
MCMDGYVRLTVVELNALRLSHRWSMQDDDLKLEYRAEGINSKLAGLTEWEGAHPTGQVYVGWGWYVNDMLRVELGPGKMGSNLMLVGPNGEDLGGNVTSDFLRLHIVTTNWQIEVRSALGLDWLSIDQKPRC